MKFLHNELSLITQKNTWTTQKLNWSTRWSLFSHRVSVRPYVRPKISNSSDNHCRPGLWAGRVDHLMTPVLCIYSLILLLVNSISFLCTLMILRLELSKFRNKNILLSTHYASQFLFHDKKEGKEEKVLPIFFVNLSNFK